MLASRCSVSLKATTSSAVLPARRSVKARAEEKEDKGGALAQPADRTGQQLFFPTNQSLTYLDGTHPADFGFDPLGLSDPEGAGGFINPDWLRYAEIYNGRWAMLGVAGCVAPEILGGAGVIPDATNILWWKTSVFPPAGTTDIYWADPWAIFWIEVVLMQFAELRRWQDYRKPGSMSKQFFLGFENVLQGSGEPAYPGGPVFNFAGMAKEGGEATKTMRTKELKNGRLAMIAMLGFAAQACMTPTKGPIANLTDHITSPFSSNLLSNLGKLGGN